VSEALSDDGGDHSGGHGAAAEETRPSMSGEPHGAESRQDPVRGLSVSESGMKIELERSELVRGRATRLRFRIVGADGRPVRDFEVEHEKRMHLIVARRDLTAFQHLHPTLGADGTWSTPVRIDEAGSYRVFADFKRDGRSVTLASDVGVDGPVDWKPLPAAARTARASDGYEVTIDGPADHAGSESELGFTVRRAGRPVRVERYLGAGGHLVALREGDMAYLHVHPSEAEGMGGHEGHGGERGASAVSFATEFPTAGRYRLFLQFKHRGEVHTAAFTREVTR
jgi:hypothetical protein